MKKVLLLLLLMISSSIWIFAQKLQNKQFVGVFRDCLIHCSTYKIKSNFTFKYSAKGDVFNEDREGTWQYIDKDRIHLYAPGVKQDNWKFVWKGEDGKNYESPIEMPDIRPINEIFVIEDEQFCNLDEENKVQFCYERVKPKYE